jgi:hypothetical protein
VAGEHPACGAGRWETNADLLEGGTGMLVHVDPWGVGRKGGEADDGRPVVPGDEEVDTEVDGLVADDVDAKRALVGEDERSVSQFAMECAGFVVRAHVAVEHVRVGAAVADDCSSRLCCCSSPREGRT